MGYIYKITNKINNKIYIGQTTTTIEHRWQDHCNEAINESGRHFLLHKAIIKYGKNNFNVEQIWEGPNSELNDKEKYFIQYYNSYFANKTGYNMTYGGEGSVKYSDAEITTLWNQGYKNCEIAEILGANPNTISLRIQNLFGEKAGTKRKTEQIKKSVLQYDVYGNFIKEWPSANEAEKQLNISSGSISRCCSKERTVANNCLWKFSNDTTTIEELMLAYAKSTKCCQVNLVDDNGNILKTYNSGKEAEQELGISRGKVSEVCNHKSGRKTANGYKFEWAYPIKQQLYKS